MSTSGSGQKSKFIKKRRANSNPDFEENKEVTSTTKEKREEQKQRRAGEISNQIQEFLEEIQDAAAQDAKLNRQSKPAVTKLQLLPTLTRTLLKKQFQKEFLDRGLLCALKKWLDPLPDGCLPHPQIRNAVLKVLQDLPIDIEMPERKQQLIQSQIGHAIMLMAKSDEETAGNRRIAEKLIKKWSREECDDDYDPPDKTDLRKHLSPEDRRILRNYGGELPGRGGRSRGRGGYKVRPVSKIVHPLGVQDTAIQGGKRWKMQQKLKQLRSPNKKKIGV